MAVPAAMSTKHLMVVGEVYLDHIFSGFERWPAPGEEALARHYRRELGGGTLITACALARLGCRVRVLGAIGAQDREVFAQRLSAFGVSADGLIDSPAGTGVTTSVSLQDDRSFFTYHGANADLSALLLRDDSITAMSAATHVHFALPLSAAVARTLLPLLARAGCSTSLDVGFSPVWLTDTANHATCRAVTWFLPNQKEAALMGCGDDADACLAWARALGLRQTVIKRGAAGAMVIDADGARRVAAPIVPVRDTTGAGDAFDAGFIAAQRRGLSLDESAQHGCHAGAACCSALGALDGLFLLSPHTRGHFMSSSVDNRKLTLIGGGGVRTPLVVYGVNEAAEALGAREIVLYDPDQERLALMVAMGRAIVAEAGGALQVHAAPSLEAAIEGAHFVLNSIRVGGIAQRASDEHTIIAHGYSGQETTGPGGVAKALRTVPVAIEQARMIERLSPDAWLVSFTNPAGLITQAISAHTRARVVGICDTPVELFHNIARALGEPAADVECEYVGLNHLGWIRGVRLRGEDILDRVLADDAILRQLYLAPLFDFDMLRALRLIPTEYLYFFYERRRALENQRASGASRGGEIERLNRTLIGDLRSRLDAGDTTGAVQTYAAYLAQRSGSYMKLEAEAGSAFAPDLAPQPDPFRASTGYHRIAVDVMSALTGARPARHVVNVRNQGAMAELADDDIVEIAADIDRDRIVPIPAAPLPSAVQGLVRTVKAYEHAAIDAALSGSHLDACKAMLIHPAIGEWSPARRLLDELFGHAHDDGHCAGPAQWRGHAVG
ncbi:PfkB family carbohydrate kinase [Xanthomonas prunicola]|uniref:PfkB family carbohydrate kinase n=2 Tax=Xanthomonas prunicola TaxID=2053930 RepID=A0A9Q9J220_9XANT|nr:PfkB family carbohydrate kinase [Xanthomonas prunicola]